MAIVRITTVIGPLAMTASYLDSQIDWTICGDRDASLAATEGRQRAIYAVRASEEAEPG